MILALENLENCRDCGAEQRGASKKRPMCDWLDTGPINFGLPPGHQSAKCLRPVDTISGNTVNSQIACSFYNVCSLASSMVSKDQQ